MPSSSHADVEVESSVGVLTLGPMRPADLAQVVAIERRSFPTPWRREHFLHEMQRNPHALLRRLRRGGQVVAYACAWSLPPELRINNLAVHPDLRRLGLGALLLEILLGEGRRLGCAHAALEVRPSNAAARRLYRRRGFVVVGRRVGYYADEGEDGIVMRLETLGATSVERSTRDSARSLSPSGGRSMLAGPDAQARRRSMGSAETPVDGARADEDYRRLEVKHRGYDERLAELRTRKFLTEEEKLEEVKLKKLKLALKDRMEAMIRRSDE